MGIFRNILRVYSWIFDGILSLLAVGVAVLAAMSRGAELRIAWLPWSGLQLKIWLAALGVVGLTCLIMATSGKLRVPLFLFSLTALFLLTRGLFFTSHSFADVNEAKRAIGLVAATLIAMIGSWPSAPRSRR